ncbi:MAG: cupin domain-containing protein [Candidatus Sulfotelmatobacter sp.]|jgi:1,2-dihydroxy-3-keto-5-methylthiopentene dioxygenase
MAIVRIVDDNRSFCEPAEVTAYLASIGIEYERWEPVHAVEPGATPDEVLAAYSMEIDKLKGRGYVAVDVIDVNPKTPDLETMLAKFNREHWHDEDEVRFIIYGRGLFHVRPRAGSLTSIVAEAGDLIRVPRGTWHWFDLCAERTIRAIRLFQDTAGWTPHYTDSGVDRNCQPVCLGSSYFPQQTLVTHF